MLFHVRDSLKLTYLLVSSARMNPIVHRYLSGRNLGDNTVERLRRALADTATVHLQPLLI
jgi:hypothetical protein